MIFKNPKFIEFDKNCTNGDSWFCSEVGMTYYKYKNENKAIEYFTKVCKNNSCLNLAKLYDLGYETNKSVQKATEFYTKSYKIGDI